MKRKIITIDGFSACGKTSIAKAVAEKLGYKYLSSGLLYRSIAWLKLNEGLLLKDLKKWELQLCTENNIDIVLATNQESKKTFKLSRELLEETSTGEEASKIAALSEVREYLIPIQRAAFLPNPIVAEGRDMGTVIFPEADVKFFIEASIEIRAARRAKQLSGSGEPEKGLVDKFIAEIKKRDSRDSTRLVAPAKPAAEAVIVSNDGSFQAGLDSVMVVLDSHFVDQ